MLVMPTPKSSTSPSVLPSGARNSIAPVSSDAASHLPFTAKSLNQSIHASLPAVGIVSLRFGNSTLVGTLSGIRLRPVGTSLTFCLSVKDSTFLIDAHGSPPISTLKLQGCHTFCFVDT
jgi:hypothetical protein